MSLSFKHGGYHFAIDDGYHEGLADHSYGLASLTGANPKGATLLKPLLKKKQEAVWVLGRLMSLYGIEPADEGERGDNAMMECALYAWPDGESSDAGFPFFVTDDRGRVSLSFGEDTPKKLSKKIAQAFAQLLLADSEDIEDYAQTLSAGDGGAAFRFGIRSALPFCTDATEGGDDDDPFAGGGKSTSDDDLIGLVEDDDPLDDDDDDDLFGDNDDDDDDDDRYGLGWGGSDGWN